MTIERSDPIPAGVYWLDLTDRSLGCWLAWRQEHAASVRVVSTEQVGDGSVSWVLFKVTAPVPRWKVEQCPAGLPTIAPGGEDTTAADTVQRPPKPKGPLDGIGGGDDGEPWSVPWWVYGAVAIGVGVAAYKWVAP